jgi:hypothetical protein
MPRKPPLTMPLILEWADDFPFPHSTGYALTSPSGLTGFAS